MKCRLFRRKENTCVSDGAKLPMETTPHYNHPPYILSIAIRWIYPNYLKQYIQSISNNNIII